MKRILFFLLLLVNLQLTTDNDSMGIGVGELAAQGTKVAVHSEIEGSGLYEYCKNCGWYIYCDVFDDHQKTCDGREPDDLICMFCGRDAEYCECGPVTTGNYHFVHSGSSIIDSYNWESWREEEPNIHDDWPEPIESRTVENSNLLDLKTLRFVKSLKKGGGKIVVTRAEVALRQHASTVLNNIKKYGVAYEKKVYGQYGDILIDAYNPNWSDSKNINNFVRIINSYNNPSLFSHHLGGYDTRCTFDISQSNLLDPKGLYNELLDRMNRNSSNYDPNILKVLIENKCIHVEYKK